MDNLSHTFAGLGAAELLHRALPVEPEQQAQRTRHRLLLTTCAIASNFPDLDLFLTPLLPEPLGYLLHHRGHTHTVLYALPQALLLCALLLALWPAARGLLRSSRIARRGFLGALVLGFGLHLAMDFLNPYGIHPFHPFDSRWFYGDAVFIIEPVFWVALGVPLIASIARRWMRVLLLGALAALLAWFTIGGYLHPVSLLGLYLLGAALAALRLRAASTAPAVATGFAALSAFLLVLAFTSQQAAARLTDLMAAMDPGSRVLDSSRSSFPANPLCWSFVTIEENEAAGSFLLRRGILSLAPELIPADACPAAMAERDLQQVLAPDLALLARYEGSIAELQQLRRDNCHFEAWLRFARAPQMTGEVATDMRFSSSARGNFTTMDLARFRGAACPEHVPQWDFPRADLLKEN